MAGKHSVCVQFIVFVAVMSVTSAQGALITNGGFETGDFSDWTVNFSPPDNAALIIDESVFPGHGRINAGTYAVDLNAYDVPATAVLSQSLFTTNGAAYDLSYAFGVIAQGDKSPSLLVEVLGNNGIAVLASETVTRGGSGIPATWSNELLSFVADGTTATVRFTDTTSPSAAADALLDSIAVTTDDLFADGNGDGTVDGLDYLVWAEHFGESPAADPPGSPENGDYNNDDVVDGLDYLAWANNFGKGSGDGAAVPEPASLSLLVLGCAALAIGRRRDRALY